MNERRSRSLAALALLALAGQVAAESECDNMRVIVRNSVFEIQGLDAFCTEFNKMKADLAGMRSALSSARAHNAVLEARLAAQSTGNDAGNQASTDSFARAVKYTEE